MPSENILARFGSLDISPSGILEAHFGLSDASSLSSSSAPTNRQFDPMSARDFYSYRSRRDRCLLFRSLNEGTAYFSQIHEWSNELKTLFGMHPDVKPVFDIFPRLFEFWADHIYCGEIDEDAGDGRKKYSSMPFLCADERSRPGISAVLKQSRFALFCHTMSRIGAMCGDVGLMAVNDPRGRRAYLEVVDPENVLEYIADPTGTCLAYRIVEFRPDPREPEDREDVEYREDAEIEYGPDGITPIGCRFRTYLDDRPYAWPENGPRRTWVEDYPFVPFVMIPHIRMSPRYPYGHSEGHNALAKTLGLDDMASRFAAQVGVAVDPIYLMAGVDPPRKGEDPVTETTAGLDANGDEVKFPAMYCGAEGKAQPLLSSLDLNHVDIHLQRRIDKLEDEYPELRKDIQEATGDASGKALRAAMMRLQTKAVVRRTAYDMGVADAIKWCLVMSGRAGYDGFELYGAVDIAENPAILEFSIDSSRSVFREAPEDRLDQEKQRLANVESADRAGIPPTLYTKAMGYEDLSTGLVEAQDEYLDRGLEVGRSKQQAPPVNDAAATAIQSKGGAKGLATGNGNGGQAKIVGKIGPKTRTA